MSEIDELKKIKKTYGENFMKLCKELFPTLLEHEGLLYKILSSTFAGNSRTLYEDIVNKKLEAKFKDYIYSKIDIERLKNKEIEERTPYELLNNVGYDLFECTTEEQIKKFKKYYSKGEELCTFNERRLDSHIVFWAVRKDVEDIKRDDFQHPKREDKYGTSVMGIQFNRYGICTVSIKNRYNHRVNNPDATYGNDLDRIVPGLTKSFEDLLLQRGLKLNSLNIEEMDIPNYTKANDAKYYKYNIEVNGVYYCPNNIVIEAGEAKKVGNPEKQILIDYFILDIEHKQIQQYNSKHNDSFTEGLRQIEKIEIIKIKENKNKVIKILIKNQEDMVLIEIDKNNQIIGYKNNQLEEVGDSFLNGNRALERLELKNLKCVGDCFLSKNERIKELNLPQLKKVENSFLYDNEILIKINLPKLKEVGNDFLFRNEEISQLNLLNLEKVSYGFLFSNKKLNKLNLPNLIQVKDNFLYSNKLLSKLNLPSLIEIGDSFLYRNEILDMLELPMLTKVGNYFMDSNQILKKLNLPNLEIIGNNFISFNREMEQIQMPKLIKTGNDFLCNNEEIIKLSLQNLKEVGNNFLYDNKKLDELDLQNLEIVGNSFLFCNEELQKLNLPNLKKAGSNFLFRNKKITELGLPCLPRLPHRLLSIIGKNLRKCNSITRKDIAQLDKNTEITTSEISLARMAIEKIRHLAFIR